MFKKMLMIGISVFTLLSLGACGKGNVSAEESTDTDAPSESENESISKNAVLIAYFSWSGNTKQLAEMIQEQVGGELFEIDTETPYTDNIDELSGISLQEQRDDIRPALNGAVEDMEQYDVVFVGFPNWWNNMPMPVFTFLEEYDFSGKTVIPFTTYGNGGWGRSVGSIQDMLPETVILDGIAVQEHELEEASSEVVQWLQGLGFTE